MFTDALNNFPKQFGYEPKVENSDNLKKATEFAVAGMGGSALSTELLNMWNPSLDIILHRNYGLPVLPKDFKENGLFIASSYSGGTEEAIDALKHAHEAGYNVAAISIGGKLIEYAKEKKIPHVVMPDTGIEPRSAIGYSIIGILKLMGMEDVITDLKKLETDLDVQGANTAGEALAKRIHDKVPVIYASTRNRALAMNWKIRFNENGKVPSFFNVFPELNHNEMIGFGVEGDSRKLSDPFYFIILRDPTDHPRIKLRMDIEADLYKKMGLDVEIIEIQAESEWKKMFQSLLVADWTGYHFAKSYGLEPEEVALVEEFKAILKERGGEMK